MNIEVELFATLRKGRFSRAQMEMPEGANVMDLLLHLEISPDDVGILVINHRDATFEQQLNAGDTVTMIPPIGGG